MKKQTAKEKSNCQIEVFPVWHNERFYNVITALDLEMVEVRLLIDWLHDCNAFDQQMKEHPDMALLVEADIGPAKIICDVMGFEIIVYKRLPNA